MSEISYFGVSEMDDAETYQIVVTRSVGDDIVSTVRNMIRGRVVAHILQ